MVELIKKEWTLLVTCAIAILAIVLFPFAASAADSKNIESHFTDSSQKSFTFFEDFYDSNQIPNEDSTENGVNNQCVSVYNDGTLEVTSQIDGLVRASDGQITFDQKINFKNLTYDKSVFLNSITMLPNEGFEDYELGSWKIVWSSKTLFEGSKYASYAPNLEIPHKCTYTGTLTTTLSGFDAARLVNKVPFNFSYDYTIAARDNYVVTIWGIGEDQYDENPEHKVNLTFGPAIGETRSCLDVDGHHEHCIHNDSWETIIDNCNAGHADWYNDCLEEGCTKKVPLYHNYSGGLFDTGNTYCYSTFSCLDNRTDERKHVNFWNGLDSDPASTSECLNYSTARIRATLVGHDDWTPSEWASSMGLGECFNSSNCLLSCFPKVLQDNIKPKYMEVATSWSSSLSAHPVLSTTFIADKLWLLSSNEIYGSVPDDRSDFGSQYSKPQSLGVTYDNYTNCITYTESDYWRYNGPYLRTAYRSKTGLSKFLDFTRVDKTGKLGGIFGWGGLSPCFCL